MFSKNPSIYFLQETLYVKQNARKDKNEEIEKRCQANMDWKKARVAIKQDKIYFLKLKASH